MILLYILYAVLGITVIIFLHEAGHFLAAKWVGVRVERFSLGFDPPFRGKPLRLFSFRRGETEYVIGMLPFGGYVKLAGEVIAEREQSSAEGELLSKPPGGRALIFVAGSAMNIISGFAFFMIAFMIGVSFTGSEVGNVLPGSPAWEAGVLPGDTVVSVGDETVTDFVEMKLAVAFAERGKPLDIGVRRPIENADSELQTISVTPRWNRQGFNEIGVDPAMSSLFGRPSRSSPAEKAGLRAGDRLLGVDVAGVELRGMSPTILIEAFQRFHGLRPSQPIRIVVERDGQALTLEMSGSTTDDVTPRAALGIAAGNGNVVRSVRKGSPAEDFFRKGDRLVAVAGTSVASVDWPTIADKWPSQDGKLELTVLSAQGDERIVKAPRDGFIRWTLMGSVHWDTYLVRVGPVDSPSPLFEAGLRKDDVVTSVAGEPIYDLEELAGVLEKSSGGALSVVVLRSGTPQSLSVPREALGEAPEGSWSTTAPIGAVREGSPAGQAGLLAGSRLVEFDGKRLSSWASMLDKVTSTPVGTQVALTWIEPDGTERRESVKLSMLDDNRFLLPVEDVRTIVQAGPVAALGLGARRTVVVSKQVFLTLRGLIRRDVSAKNLAGPVGIVHQFTLVLAHGEISHLLYWLAVISVNLGLLNLLPFPILDGGHLLFLGIEKIKGSPVDVRIQEWAINVAFFLILFLAVFVTFNDVKRLFQ